MLPTRSSIAESEEFPERSKRDLQGGGAEKIKAIIHGMENIEKFGYVEGGSSRNGQDIRGLTIGNGIVMMFDNDATPDQVPLSGEDIRKLIEDSQSSIGGPGAGAFILEGDLMQRAASSMLKKENSLGWKLVSPTVILLMILILYPVGYNIYISFFDYGITSSTFVGLKIMFASSKTAPSGSHSSLL